MTHPCKHCGNPGRDGVQPNLTDTEMFYVFCPGCGWKTEKWATPEYAWAEWDGHHKITLGERIAARVGWPDTVKRSGEIDCGDIPF